MSMLKPIALGLVLAHLTFVVWIGFWAGSVLFFGILLTIVLLAVAKPSSDVAVYE